MEGHISNASSPRAGSGSCAGLAGARCRALASSNSDKPFRSARGAQQVAIDFGQVAERAGEEAAVEDEGGDGAAADASGGDLDRALPDDQRDRAEDQEDDDRGHHRAQQDALLGGREHALDGVAKARGFAVLAG